MNKEEQVSCERLETIKEKLTKINKEDRIYYLE